MRIVIITAKTYQEEVYDTEETYIENVSEIIPTAIGFDKQIIAYRLKYKSYHAFDWDEVETNGKCVRIEEDLYESAS